MILQEKIIYSRSVKVQGILVQIIAITLTSCSILSLLKDSLGYFTFFLVLLVPFCLITLTSIEIFPDRVHFTKYLLLGVVKKDYLLSPRNLLSMDSREEELPIHDDVLYSDDSLWDIFVPTFMHTVKTSVTEFKFLDSHKKEVTLKTKLKKEEYKLCCNILNDIHAKNPR